MSFGNIDRSYSSERSNQSARKDYSIKIRIIKPHTMNLVKHMAKNITIKKKNNNTYDIKNRHSIKYKPPRNESFL